MKNKKFSEKLRTNTMENAGNSRLYENKKNNLFFVKIFKIFSTSRREVRKNFYARFHRAQDRNFIETHNKYLKSLCDKSRRKLNDTSTTLMD